jgi:16S rRNA G966 N2-methylase RsmD
MKIERIWAMPNKNTFSIPPINSLIRRNVTGHSIDPFANVNKLAMITNDIDTVYPTDFHLDALEFLKTFDDESVDCVLYDPPYSPRQVSEVWKRLRLLSGRT